MTSLDFTPTDSKDSQSTGPMGTPTERTAAVSAAFEAMGAASPERWIPPPIQQMITDYAAVRLRAGQLTGVKACRMARSDRYLFASECPADRLCAYDLSREELPRVWTSAVCSMPAGLTVACGGRVLVTACVFGGGLSAIDRRAEQPSDWRRGTITIEGKPASELNA